MALLVSVDWNRTLAMSANGRKWTASVEKQVVPVFLIFEWHDMYRKNHSKHEKPIVQVDAEGNREKNPNKITVNQHVIPQKHLEHWADHKGLLSIYNMDSNAERSIRPCDAFVVERLWDQAGEHRMLHSNEVNYHKQVDLITAGLSITEQQHLSAYFAMLTARTIVAHEARPDCTTSLEGLNYTLSQAQLEDMEVENAGSHVHMLGVGGPDSQHFSRVMVSMKLQGIFERLARVYATTEWKTFELDEGRFILPDSVEGLVLWKRPMLPITPKILIISSVLKTRLEAKGWLNEKGVNTLLRAGVKRDYVQ